AGQLVTPRRLLQALEPESGGLTPLPPSAVLFKYKKLDHRVLRSNLTAEDPAMLWQYYIQLTEVEQAFKELKTDLAIRPIHHQLDHRIEAHILIAFLAYSLQVTLKNRSRALASGLTPRAVLDKFKALSMVDVHLPTTDGRHLILSRYTEPEKDQKLLLQQLGLQLPPQLPPRVTEQSIPQSA
ncbi:MAG: hypothetical protein ACFCVA_11445, partial [Gammaproteobacteria bacterium]